MCCTPKQMRSAGLLALRLAVAVVFIYHGWGKLADIETTAGFFTMVGFPAPVLLAWLVGLVEFFGGIAILLGVYFNIATPALAIVMLTALLAAHTKMPYTAAELPIVLLGSLIALYGTGAGRYAVLNGSIGRPCAGKNGEKKGKDDGCCGGGCHTSV